MKISRSHPLVALPAELLEHITSYLSAQYISALRRVARHFRSFFPSILRLNLADPNIQGLIQQAEELNRHLSLDVNNYHLNRNILRVFFEHFNQMRSLNLSRNNLGLIDTVEIIASSQSISQDLRLLNLSANSLDSQSIQLLSTLNLPNLEILILGSNNFDIEAIAMLARATFAQNLEVLDISHCHNLWQPYDCGIEQEYLARARFILESFPNLNIIIWEHSNFQILWSIKRVFKQAAEELNRKISVLKKVPINIMNKIRD